MQSPDKRSAIRRRLWTGFKFGLSMAVFDFLFFFLLLDGVREAARGFLSTLMEPLLLVVPIAIAGLCLIGWLLTFILPVRGDYTRPTAHRK